MAPTGNNQQSCIALALAGMTDAVNIPKPRELDPGRETYATVVAKSAPVEHKTSGLPTPPNSISPSLPPQHSSVFSGQHSPPSTTHLDSDIDLEDALEHARVQDSPHRSSAERRSHDRDSPDAFGDITPSLLAKHHLPSILVQHGPLPIRHIMGYLTASVPGFPSMPPAKARRLVVAALEGRGEDGTVGGLNPQIVFEKVGWGRWSARKRGGILRPRVKPSSASLRDSYKGLRSENRASSRSRPPTGRDVSPSQYRMVPRPETDRPAVAGHRDPREKEDLDLTDEEDWASMGAAALREGRNPLTGAMLKPTSRRQYQPYVDPKSRGRGISKRPSTNFAKSLPSTSVLYGKQQQESQPSLKAQAAVKESIDFSSLMNNAKEFGNQDREAVEALLKMSSV